MKILLIQNMDYLYPWGGAHKANRILMEGLAANGHECMVITPSADVQGFKEYFEKQREAKAFEVLEENKDLLCIRKNNVVAYTVFSFFQIYSFVRAQIQSFHPDITIVSELTHNQLMLEAVLETNARTVLLSHSQTLLPFGPESYQEKPADVPMLRRLDGIVSVSNYLQDYTRVYGGLDSKVIYFPSYGEGPFPYLGSFDNPYITVINPSAIKGFSIFIGLARAMPHLSFAAVPTWATSVEELDEMKSLPNITILKPAENINDIYKQTKVFLMPSLWGESFGQVVTEAMLRGIPVIASRIGGIPEAKMGIDYLLPVKPIQQYNTSYLLSSVIPRPIVPDQDLAPWVEALTKLTSDRAHYEELSRISYDEAAAFHAKLGIAPFERYFQQLIDTVEDRITIEVQSEADANKSKMLERIRSLTPEKREALLATMKEGR
ncbi:glycosyl transferase group 1 [Paenibacillus curdlanolyticus YK9]|uniref:Glycosyl transferase group 1 n=1 Tax=Paenibacillus curdlanolyticus YK9 TaxID=717606 RepID=E0IE84_9BACL|nr:glycosyltransferase family 4 protein [Paenibacillus curdlanolyticus]EFM09438.1 glycosyl transferase group 1 [Paenibacillus curdlanolyticus YK9]